MSREYNIYSRPKLPRNKYGNLYELYGLNTSSSSSLFGSTQSASSVGVEMSSLSDFVGATQSEDGIRGLVPAPLAGEQNYFLQATGAWERIPAYEWLREFPTSNGLEKSGLEIDGDFNVTKTLSTMNLNVQGAAHFWSLIIDEVKANGGQVLVSPSMFHIDYVGDIVYYDIFSEDSKIKTIVSVRKDFEKMCRACDVVEVKCRRVWCRNDDGERRTENEVHVGDMLRCRSFNVKSGVYHNISNTDYWTFVCGVGPGDDSNDPKSFIDDDGEEKSGFWIDLAFGLRKSNGRNIPLGSVLHDDGSVDLPSDYEEISDLLGLKQVSNEVLVGSRDVENEYFDSEEFLDIQNKVIKIRGLDTSINSLIGVDSSDSLGDNTRNLIQAGQQLQFLSEGTLEGNAEEDDLSSLIMNGTYSEDPVPIQTQATLQNARSIENDINGGDGLREEAVYGLKLDKVEKNNIVLANETVLGRDFIAAEDLYDLNGDKVYNKGALVESGTVVDGEWRLVDLGGDEDIKAIDDGSEITPPDEDEIINGTDDTETNKSRDTNIYNKKNYSEETSFIFGYGKFSARKGDSLACLGHLYDSDRQNAVVLSATDPIDPDLKAPAMAQYSNIDTFGVSISKFRLSAIAANGNEFIGSFLVNDNGKYIDISERINIMITDIKSGLEKVGIHLDGDDSTITLVGSVKLKQHANDSYDTLSVYDNFDTKRVEITPFDIPKRNDPSSNIDITKNSFNYISNSLTATKDYITYDAWRHWWFWPFNSSWVYMYELNNYTVSLTSSINLGHISSGSKLDIGNLDLHIWCNTYLVGKVLVQNHGEGKQTISTLNYTLKKDGVAVSGKNKVPIPYTQYDISGINSSDIKINIGSTFLDDFTISNSGTYTIDINVVYSVYAYTEEWDYYSNYYYRIDAGLSGTLRSAIERNSYNNDTSSRKMSIGTNGMVFNCNNSRYFYAGSDGYELKWDDAGIRLDSEYGLRETKLYKTVSAGEWIDKKYDIIIANYSSNGYSLYLPNSAEYGVGRKLTIIAFKGLKVYTSGVDKVRVSTDTTFVEGECIEFGSGDSSSLVMPKYVVELIAINGVWYIVSYF